MTRRIAREEGIFAGNSAGSAMAGLLQLKDHFTEDDVIVVIFHDHGSRYLGKMFNDDWMREKGFFEKTRHDRARPRRVRRCQASCSRSKATSRWRRGEADGRARLLADLDHPRPAPRRIAERDAPLRASSCAIPRCKHPAGRDDHAAGLSVRGHLDARRAAVDDDHAVEPGRPGARLQDRQDVHHHAVGRHSRALLVPAWRRALGGANRNSP